MLNVLLSLNRLSLSSASIRHATRNISTNQVLSFKITPCLMGEPLKKKKRLDPGVIKAREERKKKKIEKQIRRLEKNSRQLKPIEECDVPLALLDEKKQRVRNLPALNTEILEHRINLSKQWAGYKKKQHLADIQMIDRFIFSQQKALDELRKESEELYLEAIQIDTQLVPFYTKGTVQTPPIENYDSPDGEYQDVSKKWDA